MTRRVSILPGKAATAYSVGMATATLLLMYLLGSAIMFHTSVTAGVVYVAVCLVGTLWFWRFICTHCRSHGMRSCPSGYGKAASFFFRKRDENSFHSSFKLHVASVVPAWVVPAAVGIVRLIGHFSWPLFSMTVLFCVYAFVIYPYLASRHSCRRCLQRGRCPWTAKMRSKEDQQIVPAVVSPLHTQAEAPIGQSSTSTTTRTSERHGAV